MILIFLYILMATSLYLTIGYIGTGVVWRYLWPKRYKRNYRLDQMDLAMGSLFWPFLGPLALGYVAIAACIPTLSAIGTKFALWANAESKTKSKDIRA